MYGPRAYLDEVKDIILAISDHNPILLRGRRCVLFKTILCTVRVQFFGPDHRLVGKFVEVERIEPRRDDQCEEGEERHCGFKP